MDGHTTSGMASESRGRSVDEFVRNAAAIANDYPGPEAAIASALCAVAYALLPEEQTEINVPGEAEEDLRKVEALLSGDDGDGLGDSPHTASWRVARLLRAAARDRRRINAVRQIVYSQQGRIGGVHEELLDNILKALGDEE